MTSLRPCRIAQDALFVSIGFGVLAVQQLQVRRRELSVLMRRLAA